MRISGFLFGSADKAVREKHLHIIWQKKSSKEQEETGMKKKNKLPEGYEMMSIFDFISEEPEPEARKEPEETTKPEESKDALTLQNEAMEALLGADASTAFTRTRLKMFGVDDEFIEEMADKPDILAGAKLCLSFWERRPIEFRFEKEASRIASERICPEWKNYPEIFDRADVPSYGDMSFPTILKPGNFSLVEKLAKEEVPDTVLNRTLYLLCKDQEEMDAVQNLLTKFSLLGDRVRWYFDPTVAAMIYLCRKTENEPEYREKLVKALTENQPRYSMWYAPLFCDDAVEEMINQIKRYGTVICLQPRSYMSNDVFVYRLMFPEETRKIEKVYFDQVKLRTLVLSKKEEK